jgi:hypothetical protein
VILVEAKKKKRTVTMSKADAESLKSDIDSAVRKELIKKRRNPTAGKKGLKPDEYDAVRRKVLDKKKKVTYK